MAIDKFVKEQTGAIGESGLVVYKGLTIEGVEKEIRKKLKIFDIRDFIYDTYSKVKGYFL